MALALFILCVQKYNFDLHNNFAHIEKFYHGILNELCNGNSIFNKDNVANATKIKMLALAAMGTYVAQDSGHQKIIFEGHKQIAAWFYAENQNDHALLSGKF